jgi:hypothetical protein
VTNSVSRGALCLDRARNKPQPFVAASRILVSLSNTLCRRIEIARSIQVDHCLLHPSDRRTERSGCFAQGLAPVAGLIPAGADQLGGERSGYSEKHTDKREDCCRHKSVLHDRFERRRDAHRSDLPAWRPSDWPRFRGDPESQTNARPEEIRNGRVDPLSFQGTSRPGSAPETHSRG